MARFTPSVVTASAPGANADWQASAFLNLYAKKPDGSRTKIGAIPFRNNKKHDRALIERLQQAGALDALLEVLELDFQLVTDEVPDVGF